MHVASNFKIKSGQQHLKYNAEQNEAEITSGGIFPYMELNIQLIYHWENSGLDYRESREIHLSPRNDIKVIDGNNKSFVNCVWNCRNVWFHSLPLVTIVLTIYSFLLLLCYINYDHIFIYLRSHKTPDIDMSNIHQYPSTILRHSGS